MSRVRKFQIGLLSAGMALVGVGVGVATTLYVQKDNTDKLQQRYRLLSKRILIDNPNDVLLDFRPLKTDLQKYLQDNGAQDTVSLYFEYLPTGSSIGLEEDKEVVGASLLKLPVVINVYKLAEAGKVNLNQTVSLKQEWLNSDYGTLYKKGAGYKITIREAIKYALEQSDNTAILLLFDVVSRAQGTNEPHILDFVDAKFDTNPSQQVLIGAQSYGAVLKCLYFGCYLNKDNSQEVLHFLTQSTATNRLTRDLPKTLLVAHKIGSYGQEAQSDCGVFYVNKRNYLLCVMVQGQDQEASNYIADLSKIVYDRVSSK